MHCHPANLLAMTYIHTLDEREFTRTLWQMCTECIVVFPDGVNVLPWMLCGTNEIGKATAEKMQTARLVVWSQHGIYGAGKDLDETFGAVDADFLLAAEGRLFKADVHARAQAFAALGRVGVRARAAEATAEKAAEIYIKTAPMPRINTITDEQMHMLENRFGVTARKGYLD